MFAEQIVSRFEGRKIFTKEIVSRKKNVRRGDSVKEEKCSPRRWCQGRKMFAEEIVSRKKNVY